MQYILVHTYVRVFTVQYITVLGELGQNKSLALLSILSIYMTEGVVIWWIKKNYFFCF